jgi:hypothetical protein
VISYRKAEIEDLVHAIGRHWGGQASDWRLVVGPTHRNAPATVALHVEIALGTCTRTTTIPLGQHHGDSTHRLAAHIMAPHDQARGSAAAVAAVRRVSVQALLAQSGSDDIEALLGYLRCCGIMVMD